MIRTVSTVWAIWKRFCCQKNEGKNWMYAIWYEKFLSINMNVVSKCDNSRNSILMNVEGKIDRMKWRNSNGKSYVFKTRINRIFIILLFHFRFEHWRLTPSEEYIYIYSTYLHIHIWALLDFRIIKSNCIHMVDMEWVSEYSFNAFNVSGICVSFAKGKKMYIWFLYDVRMHDS